jgi:hypothetical protein
MSFVTSWPIHILGSFAFWYDTANKQQTSIANTAFDTASQRTSAPCVIEDLL